LEWLLVFDRYPEKADSYVLATVKTRNLRIDQFYSGYGWGSEYEV